MMRYLFILVLLASLYPVSAHADNTWAQAQTLCQQYQSAKGYGSCYDVPAAAQPPGTCGSACPDLNNNRWIWWYSDTYSAYSWPYVGGPPPPPPPACQNLPDITGSIVAPSGDGLPEASYNGCCYIPSSAAGGANDQGQQLIMGDWSPTGQACDGTHPGLISGSDGQPNTSSTNNGDGSNTQCTTGTKNPVCITNSSSSGQPPASSSSAPNGSTDYSSTTNNPASSSSTTSSSTSTTTTTGSTSGPASGSSSGGATTTGTTTTTGHSTTDNPASSSSTSGKCTEGVCDVGKADGVVGSLYTSSGDSISAEFASYRAQIANTPLASAVPQFLAFTPSGSCPTWTIPGNQYWGAAGFSFAFLCQPSFLALLQAAGMIVLAVAAFSAFRIAIY